MSERIFIDGDSVLYAPVVGQALKKFKVFGAIWDSKNNEWLYKIKNVQGEELKNINEKQLTMD